MGSKKRVKDIRKYVKLKQNSALIKLYGTEFKWCFEKNLLV